MKWSPNLQKLISTRLITENVSRAAVLALGMALVVSAASVPPVQANDDALATDSFSRKVGSSWGSANLGGKYQLMGPSENLSVDGSSGIMVLRQAGETLGARLPAALGRDVNMRVTFSMDRLPTKGRVVISLLSRSVVNNSFYRAVVRVASTGKAAVRLARVVDGRSTDLGIVAVTGFRISPGIDYKFRFRAVGTSPTVLKAVVWPASKAQPRWTIVRKDSATALQVAGAVGIRTAATGAVTGLPIKVAFDDLTARDLTPATTITIQPVKPGSGDYLLMPRAELMSLPTSGSAWNYMSNIANGSWGTINLMNQDSQANTMALAGALVYARTGNAAMRTKVRNAIMTMVPTFDPSANSGLAVGRQMAAWVMAADFIDLKTMDPAADTTFRAHVLRMLTASKIGTQGGWGINLRVTHNDSPNNHGGWAGASRIASDLYLGNQATDLAAAANTTRGFLGSRAHWAKFRDQKGNADSTIASWMCNPNRLTGATPVNPPCVKNGINVGGAVVADVSRQDVSLRWPPSSTGAMYTSEVIAGMLLQVELLHRNGYPTIYDFQSQALKRMADVLTRIDAAGGDGWNRGSVQTHMSWLLNRRYGTNYPTVNAQPGRSFGYTDWLYGR